MVKYTFYSEVLKQQYKNDHFVQFFRAQAIYSEYMYTVFGKYLEIHCRYATYILNSSEFCALQDLYRDTFIKNNRKYILNILPLRYFLCTNIH